MKNYKTKYIYIIGFILCFCHLSYSQTNKTMDLSSAFKIGDQFVPPTNIALMRGDNSDINWSLLENKVVVLDFFDTFCTSCIAAMPHLQKLQDKLFDKLKIINVGWQDKATLDKFFAGNAYLKENKVNLPVIHNDTYLQSRFPHQGVPHVAILYKGKVQAITFASSITEENILELYHKGTINLPIKDDFNIGTNIGQNEMNIKGGTWISGYKNGVVSQALKFEEDSITGLIRTSTFNRSIFRILLNAWTKIKQPGFLVNSNRVIWTVKDPTQYDDINHIGEEWTSKFGISYERVDRFRRADSVQAKVILNDLHQFLGVRSYWETKNVDCLILQACPKTEDAGQTVGKGTKYEGTSVLATMIDIQDLYPPVDDRVKSNEMLTLAAFNSLDELNVQLRFYGMELVKGKGDMEMFIIEEVN